MGLITRYSRAEDNKGGFCQIRILKRCDFDKNQVLYARYRGEGIINISANDTLENVFPVCYHTPLLGDYEQPRDRNKFGAYYKQKLKFSVPKDRPEILREITQLQDEPLFVLFKNGNDDWKAIGTEEDWAMLSVSQKTGGVPSDPNVYIFEIDCVSRYLSPFLQFEERVVVIPDPPASPCFETGEGVYIVATRPRVVTRVFTTARYNRVGLYRVVYKLTNAAQIIVRDFQTAAIIDVRNVNAGQGSYTFSKGAQFIKLVIDKLGTSPDYVAIDPPCLDIT
jgi:hypothetical protein